MTNYTKGQTYEFEVQKLLPAADGRKYIYVGDDQFDYRVTPFDYQLEDEYEFPKTLYCDVVDFTITGRPLLMQNKQKVLEELYEDHYDVHPRKEFRIVKKGQDGSAHFLLLKDEYGVTHRYYYQDNSEYVSGETIELCIEGINHDTPRPYLKLTKPKERTRFIVDSAIHPKVTPIVSDKQFGEEDLHTEFKSSIVFCAKHKGTIRQNEPSIDDQIPVIMKEIAAFMNTEGGTLYIGVEDNGTISGIEKDYPHLQTSLKDRASYDVTNKTESQKQDIYANKIRNSIVRLISSIAGSFVNISFKELNGKTICIIEVKVAPKPMFVNGILYQRQGASSRPLEKDDISYFILNKLKGEAITQFLEHRLGYDTPIPDDTVEETNTEESSSDNTAWTMLPSEDEDDRDHRIWKTFNFFDNGYYCESGRIFPGMQNAQIVKSIAVEKYQKSEHQVLLMQYANGCINAVEYGSSAWADRGYSQNGSYLARDPSAVLDRVYSADIHDMVVVFCERDNETFVRVVNVSDIGVHRVLYAQGNMMAPGDYKVTGLYPLSSDYRRHVAALIKKVGPGFPVMGDKKTNTIKRLITILQELNKQ